MHIILNISWHIHAVPIDFIMINKSLSASCHLFEKWDNWVAMQQKASVACLFPILTLAQCAANPKIDTCFPSNTEINGRILFKGEPWSINEDYWRNYKS